MACHLRRGAASVLSQPANLSWYRFVRQTGPEIEEGGDEVTLNNSVAALTEYDEGSLSSTEPPCYISDNRTLAVSEPPASRTKRPPPALARFRRKSAPFVPIDTVDTSPPPWAKELAAPMAAWTCSG